MIGHESDIKAWTLDDLVNYHKTYYAPNNAVMVIAGDVQLDNVKKLAKQYLEPIPAQAPPANVRTVEPKQTGERRVFVEKASVSTPNVMLAYHIPEAKSDDYYALDILSSILSDGKSSRLYQGLVDKQVALAAETYMPTSFDPNLFYVYGIASPGVSEQTLEKALIAQINDITDKGVSQKELDKIKNIKLMDFYRTMETINGKANTIGTYELYFGSYKKLFDAPRRYNKVTSEDIQRVAQTYLIKSNRTVGVFSSERGERQMKHSPITKSALAIALAIGGLTLSACNSTPSTAPQTPQSNTVDTGSFSMPAYEKYQLDNGLTVYLMQQKEVPLVTVDVVIRAGSVNDALGGEARLTAKGLMLGAGNRSKSQIEQAVDFLGASLGSNAGKEGSVISSDFMIKDTDTMLPIINDVLVNPKFDSKEFSKLKDLEIAGLSQAKESPRSVIGRYFDKMIFGNSAYGKASSGDSNSLRKVSVNTLKGFYHDFYQPKNTAITVVGDFNVTVMKQKVIINLWVHGKTLMW